MVEKSSEKHPTVVDLQSNPSSGLKDGLGFVITKVLEVSIFGGDKCCRHGVASDEKFDLGAAGLGATATQKKKRVFIQLVQFHLCLSLTAVKTWELSQDAASICLLVFR